MNDQGTDGRFTVDNMVTLLENDRPQNLVIVCNPFLPPPISIVYCAIQLVCWNRWRTEPVTIRI
jgi:hypothetical protein